MPTVWATLDLAQSSSTSAKILSHQSKRGEWLCRGLLYLGLIGCYASVDLVFPVAMGRVKEIVVPGARLSAIQMRPSCASIRALQMAKPSPAPFIFVGLVLSPSCQNASKTLTRSSSGIPGPWSLTSHCTTFPSTLQNTSIVVSGAEYLTALLIKLTRTCAMRCASTITDGRFSQ